MNMVHSVTGNSPLDAWKQGAQLLVSNGPVFNLITTVSNPTELDKKWFKNFNPANIKCGIQNVSEVATTIFPYKYTAHDFSREQLYQRYILVHERAKNIHPKRGRLWGTYFDRMIRFGSDRINQLEKVVDVLQNWNNNPKCALVIHTSSADTDNPKPLGAPCLQYVQFLCPDSKTISMLAVYRNHDFFGKVLGNFVGLGQLLNFLCQQTKRTPGILVCHSAHAYFNSSKKDFRKLIQF